MRNNEKFLSPSEARRKKKFRIHLSCVCAYTSLEGGDFSFVTIMDILRAAKTALTIFFKLCIPPFLGLKNFVLGFLRFKNWSIRPKIRPESLKKDHFFKKKSKKSEKILKNRKTSTGLLFDIFDPKLTLFNPQKRVQNPKFSLFFTF